MCVEEGLVIRQHILQLLTLQQVLVLVVIDMVLKCPGSVRPHVLATMAGVNNHNATGYLNPTILLQERLDLMRSVNRQSVWIHVIPRRYKENICAAFVKADVEVREIDRLGNGGFPYLDTGG